ncbi:MAG: phosphoglucosamine mutase [Rickettsiales bacterium]|nr:phosphoglucosamine mutase [Rickettsiales bacterium]
MGKFFGTDGIRGIANEGIMTAEVVMKLGMAIGTIFKNGSHKHKVVIGKDTRLSGYLLEPALTSGFIAVGIDVLLVGPMPTPAVAMLTKSLRADLGIVLSASHNPFQYNGIKAFTSQGLKIDSAMEAKIENLMLSYPDNISFAKVNDLGKAIRLDDAPGRYIEFVKNTFPKSKNLNDLKIVIDSANGASYHIVKNVFWELGAEVIHIGNRPDGLNINEDCGSIHPQEAVKHVLQNKADLGIVLDGDADRVILIDELGNLINGDKILAATAVYLKSKNKLAQNTVVATTMSNLNFEKYLAQHNISLIRTQVGDRYVAKAMSDKELNLGGEQSGHIINADFGFTGDGIIAALQILAYFVDSNAGSISKLCNTYKEIPQKIFNIKYENIDVFRPEQLTELTNKFQQELGIYGRISIRKSGTEPVIRVMLEHESETEIEHIFSNVSEAIKLLNAGIRNKYYQHNKS